MRGGARVWYFPDGYLPAKTSGEASDTYEAHESLMLLNVQNDEAAVVIDLYFSDRPPIKNIEITVPAERIIALRLDQPSDLGGAEIPIQTQYALRITSDRPIVAQFGRLDTTQSNLSYYGSDGFCEAL